MRILILAASLVLSNSFLFAQEPDWVRGKSREYQDEFYIVGVGSGDTRQDAESQARAHIAEVFKVKIKADISVNKSETLKNSGGKISAESREVTRSKIDLGLKKTLEGTEIAEVWQNPKDATFYALAVLDREKASMKFAERIRELDAEVVRLGGNIDSATTKIGKLKLLLLKKSLMSDRRELDSDFRIVSSTGKGIDPQYSYERENSEIAGFLQNDFVIGITGDGPGSEIMTQTVTDLFTGNGFVVRRISGKEADLLITILGSTEAPGQPVDGWYYSRWHIELNASDASNGDVILSTSENGRSGQLSRDESMRRAIYDMNKKVSGLAGKIIDRLNGIGE
jgi:LPP20 lipoprotein